MLSIVRIVSTVSFIPSSEYSSYLKLVSMVSFNITRWITPLKTPF
jgi:hypothetical protein